MGFDQTWTGLDWTGTQVERTNERASGRVGELCSLRSELRPPLLSTPLTDCWSSYLSERCPSWTDSSFFVPVRRSRGLSPCEKEHYSYGGRIRGH